MSASPGDTQPVFDLIVRRAVGLCNSSAAGLLEFDGDLVHYRTSYGVDPAAVRAYAAVFPMAPTRESIACRAILDKRIIHIRDMDAEPQVLQVARNLGMKSNIAVPLLRDGAVIGALTLTANVTGGFSDSQVALLQTFAEQAVIAIGSAETYRELQTRTAALAARNSEFGERIEQQSATIDVLKVMSSTPDDTQPVFDLITRRARELCNGTSAGIFEYDGELVHFRSVCSGIDPEALARYSAAFPMTPTRASITCRAILDRQIVHIRDADAEPELLPMLRDLGMRSFVSIPLLRDGAPIGAFALNAKEPGGFTDSQLALLQTFAEQAAIAITSVANYPGLARSHRCADPLGRRTPGARGSAARGEFLARPGHRACHHHQPRCAALARRRRHDLRIRHDRGSVRAQGRLRDDHGAGGVAARTEGQAGRNTSRPQRCPACARAYRRRATGSDDHRCRQPAAGHPCRTRGAAAARGQGRRRAGDPPAHRWRLRADHGHAAADLRRTIRARHRERATVRGCPSRTHRRRDHARRSAPRAGPAGAIGEDGLARPAHRRHRARDQEPAQLRQQFCRAFRRSARRTARRGGTGQTRHRRRPARRDRRPDRDPEGQSGEDRPARHAAPTASSRICCCIHAPAPANTARSM